MLAAYELGTWSDSGVHSSRARLHEPHTSLSLFMCINTVTDIPTIIGLVTYYWQINFSRLCASKPLLYLQKRTKKLLQEGCNNFVMWWWCLLHQSFCLWSLLCPFKEVLMWWDMSQETKIQFLNLNSVVFANPVTFNPQSVLLLNLWSRIKSCNSHKLLENGLKYLFLYALNVTITQCNWYLSSTAVKLHSQRKPTNHGLSMLELKFPNWVSMFNDTDQGAQQDEWRTEDKITKFVVSNCDILKMSRNAWIFVTEGSKLPYGDVGTYMSLKCWIFFLIKKDFTSLATLQMLHPHCLSW
jgi:hypothetical protein